MIEVTIIICSSRRTEIFIKTLSSIIENETKIPILIVDNNSKAELESAISCIKDRLNIRIVHEPQLGLSHARNTGIKEVNSEWILFLDDDIQLPEGFFDKLITIIESEQFDCFGGMYYPWYPQGKPAWLPTYFGKKTPLLAHTGPIDVHKDGFLSAGIMCVKREVIEAVGGFRTDLGMTNSIGYGEEDDLQLRLQAAGYRLGFEPDWWLYHAVLAHKHQVSWHLKSAYAHGRDGQRVIGKTRLIEIVIKNIRVNSTLLIKRIPLSIYKLIFVKNFYWQNAVIYSLLPSAKWLGHLIGELTCRKIN
jgi:GT2 family glycosyltransferase